MPKACNSSRSKLFLFAKGLLMGFWLHTWGTPLSGAAAGALDSYKLDSRFGVFIGCNTFAEGTPKLKYAAKDAIDMASLFVDRLRTIPPSNCWLHVSGANALERGTLASLAQLGVHCSEATRESILESALVISNSTRISNSFLLVYASTHGFQEFERPYLGTASTNGKDEGLDLIQYQHSLGGAAWGQNLLILDACRKLKEGTHARPRFNLSQLRETPWNTFSATEPKEASYEGILSQQNGQFTFHFIRALLDEWQSSLSPYVPLDPVIRRSTFRLLEHSIDGKQQNAWFSGRVAALHSIILAVRLRGWDGYPETWTNSLGIPFCTNALPGTYVARIETRVQDFQKFLELTHSTCETRGSGSKNQRWTTNAISWNSPGFAQTPDHPVVGISAKDAAKFLEWLTLYEKETLHRIPSHARYRLLTFSEYLQLATNEVAAPALNSIGGVHGNIAGEEIRKTGAVPQGTLSFHNYDDGSSRTAPVASYAPSMNGIFDLDGNVSEFTSDCPGCQAEEIGAFGPNWGSGPDPSSRTIERPRKLNMVRRLTAVEADSRYGFRCALELDPSTP